MCWVCGGTAGQKMGQRTGGSLRGRARVSHHPPWAPPPPYLWAVKSGDTQPLTSPWEEKAAKRGFSRSSRAAGSMTSSTTGELKEGKKPRLRNVPECLKYVSTAHFIWALSRASVSLFIKEGADVAPGVAHGGGWSRRGCLPLHEETAQTPGVRV